MLLFKNLVNIFTLYVFFYILFLPLLIIFTSRYTYIYFVYVHKMVNNIDKKIYSKIYK